MTATDFVRQLSRPAAALALVAGLLGARTPAFADNSAIGFAPDSLTASPGETFKVDVVANLAEEVRGVQFGLKFDPAVVQITSITEGPYLKDWARAHHGQSAVGVPFQVDNARGEVSIGGIVILGGDSAGGPAGPGVLATVQGTVRPEASASSALTLTAVKFASTLPDAAAVPNMTVLPGGVAVGDAPVPPPDAAGGTLQTPGGVGIQSDGSTIVDQPDGASDTGAALAASDPRTQPIWHDVLRRAQADEPPPIIVPTSAPVFASDLQTNATATAVAGAASATALSRAVVAVTPPAPRQPHSLMGVSEPTPRPAPQTPQSQRLTFAPTPTPRPTTVNTALRPTGSSGVLLPWELLAGIGGGVIAAGLVLVGFRRSPLGPTP